MDGKLDLHAAGTVHLSTDTQCSQHLEAVPIFLLVLQNKAPHLCQPQTPSSTPSHCFQQPLLRCSPEGPRARRGCTNGAALLHGALWHAGRSAAAAAAASAAAVGLGAVQVVQHVLGRLALRLQLHTAAACDGSSRRAWNTVLQLNSLVRTGAGLKSPASDAAQS